MIAPTVIAFIAELRTVAARCFSVVFKGSTFSPFVLLARLKSRRVACRESGSRASPRRSSPSSRPLPTHNARKSYASESRVNIALQRETVEARRRSRTRRKRSLDARSPRARVDVNSRSEFAPMLRPTPPSHKFAGSDFPRDGRE